MGGKAIQKYFNLPEKRIDTKTFWELYYEIVDIIRNSFPTGSFSITTPSFFSNKESHGDIDIICSPQFPLKYLKFAQYIEDKFGYKPHINGEVYTIPYKN